MMMFMLMFMMLMVVMFMTIAIIVTFAAAFMITTTALSAAAMATLASILRINHEHGKQPGANVVKHTQRTVAVTFGRGMGQHG